MLFRSKKTKIFAGMLIAAALSFTARADYVDTDWHQEGDALASLDLNTGKEWLKLTETAGLSLPEVNALIETDYVGWRLPTQAEVNAWMYSLTDLETENNGFNQYTVSADVAEYVVSALGNTHDEGDWRARGLYLNDSQGAGSDLLMSGGTYYPLMNGSHTVFDDYQRGDNMDYSLEYYGVFLVSDGGVTWSSINNPSINQVPIPLAASVLIMVPMLMNRKRKQ